jgi:WD40 repeat protein
MQDITPSNEDRGDRYNAFISYSRKDVEFATKFEKALERFRPPKGLTKETRFLNIFRDQADFVGVDYFKSIEKDLRNSRKLLVICSPAARDSEYVSDEIRRFAKSNGPENIVPVIIAGVPNNEARPGDENKLAFPGALTESLELPLAADFREFDADNDRIDKGRFSAAWYTVLANILDVSRAEVEKREERRRRRKFATVISITGTIILALAALSIFALVQRDTAIKERDAATRQKDGLIVIQSRSLLQRDPTAALAVLRHHSFSKERIGALRMRAAAAYEQGVALQVLESHHGGTSAVAFSPDEQLFASAGGDDRVRVRDVSSWTDIADLRYEGRVSAMLFSPDSQYLAVAGFDGPVILWERTTKTTKRLEATKQGANVLAFSPDASKLAAARKSITIWDLSTGRSKEFVDHKREIVDIAFDGKGERLVSACQAGEPYLLMWNLSTGEKQTLKGLTDGVRHVAFSPDSHLLVASGGLDRSIRVWRAQAEEPKILPIKPDRRSGQSASALDRLLDVDEGHLAFSPDGEFMVTGHKDGLRLWDMKHMRMLAHSNAFGRIRTVEFSGDGHTLVGAGMGGPVIWDLKSGLGSQRLGHQHRIEDIALSSSGNLVASASTDGTVRIWQVDIPQLTVAAEQAVIAALNSVDNAVIYVNRSGDLKSWDLATGDLTTLLKGALDSRVIRAALNHNGTQLASIDQAGQLTVRKVGEGAVKTWQTKAAQPFEMGYSPDGMALVVLYENSIDVWGLDGTLKGQSDAEIVYSDDEIKREVQELMAKSGMHPFGGNFRFSADGKTIVWFFRQDSLWARVLDLVSNRWKSIELGEGGAGGFAVSPDGKLLAYSNDNLVQVVDIEQGLKKSLEAHRDVVFDLVFSPDGTSLASTARNGILRIWNLKDMTSRLFTMPIGIAEHVAYSSDGHTLAAWDVRLYLWDLESGEQRKARCNPNEREDNEIELVMFSEDGAKIVCITDDHEITSYEDRLPWQPSALKTWINEKTRAEFDLETGMVQSRLKKRKGID